MIGVRLSGAGASAGGGAMDNGGLRGIGVALLVFFESVARLTGAMSVTGGSPTLYMTMPRSK